MTLTPEQKDYNSKIEAQMKNYEKDISLTIDDKKNTLNI